MFVTPDLCDENPELVSVALPMFRNYGGRDRFYGEIVSVKCFEDNTFVKSQLGTPGKGKVLVVDGGGSKRCALLGDLIAANAAKHLWEGVIIYGCVRDVDELERIDLGVQALASIPLKSVRQDRGDLNISVRFADITFEPGHYVYADPNGVIVSPEPLKLPE